MQSQKQKKVQSKASAAVTQKQMNSSYCGYSDPRQVHQGNSITNLNHAAPHAAFHIALQESGSQNRGMAQYHVQWKASVTVALKLRGSAI
jgi:hypothetical protein